MSENLNNKKYKKEIESEISLDEIMMNQIYFQKNQNYTTPININIPKKSNNYQYENILLNSLQDFYNRYEKDDRKILSNKKFVISFTELISLLRETILAQLKIDNLIYTYNDSSKNNLINIQKINQKYINDLSYNIFSYDKIDIGYGFNIKKKKNIYSNISPNNMKFQNYKKNNKNSYNQKSYISPNNIKKEINNIFENIYKEVFINGNNNNPLDGLNITHKKQYKKKDISKNKNSHHERNKSAILKERKKAPLSYNKMSKNNISNNDNQRLNNTVINNISNNISYNSNNFNINNDSYNSLYKNYGTFSENQKKLSKSTNFGNKKLTKSKTFKNNKKFHKSKNSDKNKLKVSDIFLACENINKIRNSSNKRYLSRSNNNYFHNNINLNENDSFLKKSMKSMGIRNIYNNSNYSDVRGYEELRLNNAMIKRIIVTNTHKPSNLANKLLVSGQKYIDDFKEINEEIKKKE